MSAAFSLAASGPPAPCGYPGCTLESFHDGDHLFAAKPEPKSRPRRYHCIVCGVDVVEYGHLPGAANLCDSEACLLHWCARSAELQPLRCNCPQRAYAHDLSLHAKLQSEAYNPKLRYTYPWSLVLSPSLEPSTECLVGADQSHRSSPSTNSQQTRTQL